MRCIKSFWRCKGNRRNVSLGWSSEGVVTVKCVVNFCSTLCVSLFSTLWYNIPHLCYWMLMVASHVNSILMMKVYIYVYTHIYIHIHTHTYMHTHIHTYIHTYMNTYMHTYIRTYVSMHAYGHTYINMRARVREQTHDIAWAAASCTLPSYHMMKISLFWDIDTVMNAKFYQRFRGAWCLQL